MLIYNNATVATRAAEFCPAGVSGSHPMDVNQVIRLALDATAASGGCQLLLLLLPPLCYNGFDTCYSTQFTPTPTPECTVPWAPITSSLVANGALTFE